MLLVVIDTYKIRLSIYMKISKIKNIKMKNNKIQDVQKVLTSQSVCGALDEM